MGDSAGKRCGQLNRCSCKPAGVLSAARITANATASPAQLTQQGDEHMR